MSVDMTKVSSRPLGVAKNLIGRELDETQVYSKSVVLTGEPKVLKTANGHWCFMNSLRILVRVVGQLTVVLPPGFDELEHEVRQCCTENALRETRIQVSSLPTTALVHADAILNIGCHVDSNLPVTSINSNGWVARVSSCSGAMPSDVGQSNPIAALMAASFGVTEVFKRILGVPDEIAPLLEYVEFSLFELTTEPLSLGPEIPNKILFPDTLIVGAGAVGNGIALLLSHLPIQGCVHFVDKQNYQDENLGTSILLAREGWVRQPKAVKLASWLSSNSAIRATGERSLINDALAGEQVKSLAVDLVLNALDDVQARHDSQLIWPAVMVDGGINEVGAAVVQHRLDKRGLACLRCSFELPKVDHQALQQEMTGLSATSLADQNRPLEESDIAEAAPSMRPWLRTQMQEGRTVCSVVTEAGLRRLGVNVEDGFRPSVPFVATAAAALVVAEAVKSQIFPRASYPQWFSLGSMFLGPAASAAVARHADPSCLCVSQRKLIDRLRQMRCKQC